MYTVKTQIFKFKDGRCLQVFLYLICLSSFSVFAQGVKFNGDFSPSEGIVKPQEKPYRDEICLNGSWEFQPVAVPKDWLAGKGAAPELVRPIEGKWEKTKIKIPSPWNVNDWGGGSKVGKGTDLPYAPSSVYYPSYPSGWEKEKMGWLKRSFTVPANWAKKRIILHFEAVAGECLVVVNGKEVGRHFDQFLPFEVDVTEALKYGDNELMVGVRHAKLFNKNHPVYSKFKTVHPLGSNADKLVGIWQDVFLQAVPATRIKSIFVKPFVERDELEFEVELVNQSQQAQQLTISGDIKEWLNQASVERMASADIKWTLGETALDIPSQTISIKQGETKKVNIKIRVGNKLKFWSPPAPNLYTVGLQLKSAGRIISDRKTERFGWRSFNIKGSDFHLNGQKIQAYGDLQHPFGPYITSRRFAWAWYKMIKDVGGNAVRPHAQPWPRVYYDLADEMGLLVLDETGLFGSSINLNFEDEEIWTNSEKHLTNLILRDRNHPSVVGWSVGNELFAISLLNKPPAEVARKWDDKITSLARIPALIDPTRQLITVDGDKDMHGSLPVFS